VYSTSASSSNFITISNKSNGKQAKRIQIKLWQLSSVPFLINGHSPLMENLHTLMSLLLQLQLCFPFFHGRVLPILSYQNLFRPRIQRCRHLPTQLWYEMKITTKGVDEDSARQFRANVSRIKS